MFWLDGQAFEKIRTERLLTRKSRVKVYDGQTYQTKRMKILVKYMNAHQKASIPEEMDKLYTSYDCHSPSLHSHSVLVQWTCMQNAMATETDGM